MDKRPLIIYGTGGQALNALNIVRNSYREYEPVAYTSKRPEKVGQTIFSLPVISHEEVRKKYGRGGFSVLISPEPPTRYEIQNEIIELGFVTREQIVNYTEVRKHVSCRYLETKLVVGTKGCSFCCAIPDWGCEERPSIQMEDDVKKIIADAMRYRDRLIADLQDREKVTPCTGCCMLKEQYYRVDRKFLDITFGMDYPCNLACTYCWIPTNKGNIHRNREHLKQELKFDAVGFARELEAQNAISKDTCFYMVAGEISVAPKAQELLDAISAYKVQVSSNAVRYNEKVAELCSRPDGSSLLVSMDAGTGETYRLVRGADAYEQAKETLRRYKKKGVNLELKYIVIPENCGKADLDGFADFAAELAVDTVIINRNQFVRLEELDREIYEAAEYLKAACKARGIRDVRLDFTV